MNKIKRFNCKCCLCFAIYHYFCYHMKCLSVISNFLKVDKVIVCNWYQILDNKLIRECAESVLQSLDSRLTYQILQILVVAKRLYLKKLKEAYRHKEKIHRALIEK